MTLISRLKNRVTETVGKLKRKAVSIGKKAISATEKIAEVLSGNVDAKPISSMTYEEKLFAQFANEAYAGKSSRKKNIEGYEYDLDLSDDKTAIYYHPEKKYVKFAIRGTKADPEDVSDDLIIAHDGTSGLTSTPRFKRMEDLYKRVVSKYGDKIFFTGHSLGGSYSIQMSFRYNKPCVTFNAGSSPIEKLRKTNGKILNLKIVGDLISSSKSSGKTKWFTSDAKVKHSMSNFL